MSSIPLFPLEEFIPSSSGSVDPSKFRNEVFDLYSIPAFDKGKPEVIVGSDIGSTKQVVEPGDVLLSKIVPHIRRAWVVGEHRGRRLIASGEWIVFGSPKIYPNYLRHVLVENSFHAKFMKTVSGVGGSLLRARPAYVADIDIPVPDLPEQKRIAAFLEKADRLRRTRRYVRQLSDTFLQSVFLEMFGDLTKNQFGWEFDELENCAEVVSGVAKGQKYGDKKTVEVPYLRVANVQDGYLDLSVIKKIKVPHEDVEALRLEPGDVLMTEGGDFDKLGRGAIWRGQVSNCIHQNHIFRVRLDRSRVLPIFFAAFL